MHVLTIHQPCLAERSWVLPEQKADCPCQFCCVQRPEALHKHALTFGVKAVCLAPCAGRGSNSPRGRYAQSRNDE